MIERKANKYSKFKNMLTEEMWRTFILDIA